MKNEKIIKEIRELYNKRWGEYKGEFDKTDDKQGVTCF